MIFFSKRLFHDFILNIIQRNIVFYTTLKKVYYEIFFINVIKMICILILIFVHNRFMVEQNICGCITLFSKSTLNYIALIIFLLREKKTFSVRAK